MRCGARASWSGTSRSRCCCPTCWCSTSRGCLAQMIDAARDLPAERQHHRGRGGAGRARAHVRRGRRRRAQGQAVRAHRRWWRSPPRETAPSNLIITGRYILQPEIFDVLAAEKRGAGGEIQLTDAMIELARTPAVLRPEVRRPQLRLRLEGRLPRPPTSPMRSSAPISRRRCGRSSGACSARASRAGPNPLWLTRGNEYGKA